MRLKNEVVVGIVVVLGLLIIAIGGYWMTGRAWGREQRVVTATFREVGLLEEGNPVKFRGVRVGRVERIELAPRGDGVFATLSVNPDVVFPSDAAVVLSAESFFGDWQAAIVSRRAFPDLQFTVATGAGVLPGAALPDITELTAVAARISGDLEVLSNRVQLAFTEETAVRIRQTIENVNDITRRLSGFVDQQTVAYRDASRNVVAATANVRDATATAKQAAAAVGGQVSQGDIRAMLANARQSSENLREFSEQLRVAGAGVPGLVTRVDTTLGTISATAAGVGTMVNGIQPQLQQLGPTIAEARQAIATLQRASAKIEEGNGTLGRLISDPALYEETQRAIVTLQRLLADLQQNPGKYIGQLKVF